jgi:hypothetical protein
MFSQQSSDRDQVEPKRLRLILIIAAASGIGLFPYLLFIDQVPYLLVVIPVAALMAFFALRRLVTDATEEPSLGEWLLGAWSAVLTPSIVTFIGFVMYGIGFGLASLAGYLLKLFAFAFPIDPPTWGYWASLPFAAIFSIALPLRARHLFYSLYPRTAGSRSVFFQLLGRPWTIPLALGSIAALVIMVVLLDPRGIWFPLLLFLLIFYSALPLDTLLEERRHDRRQTEIIEIFALLLESAGYDVTRSPRTSKPEIDPMIQSIDMLARSTAKAFAIEVKSSESSELIEWHEAATLRTASSVLQDELAEDPKARVRIEPILVLVGAKLAPSLVRFSEKERVPVLHLADPSILQANSDAIASRLRAIGVPIPAGEPSPSLGAA